MAAAITERNTTFSDRNSKRLYWLRGLLRCGRCHLALCGFCAGPNTKRPHQKSVYYYRCNSVYAKRGACGVLMINALDLEDAVWMWCRKRFQSIDATLDEIRQVVAARDNHAPSAETNVEAVAAALDERRREKARVSDLLVRGAIDEEDAVRSLARLRTEIETLEAERDRAAQTEQRRAQASAQLTAQGATLRRLRRSLKHADTDDRRKREILDHLVERIVVLRAARTDIPTIEYSYKIG